MNIKDELLKITDALDRAGIPHAVCGGFAVVIHGCPRLTQDIDVLIQESDLESARRAVAAIGFDLESGLIRFRTGQPDEDRLHRFTKIEGSDYLTLDFMVVTPFLQDVWESRQRVELGDREMSVISRDGLIKMKKAAGRLKDRLDVSMLEGEEPQT